jgi:23S rRNA (cytidine1920-2'-O)/16S rRNA (cytidine1409-2'-O)-methyltransferase
MKQRIDEAMVERGLAETRARAQALIMGGAVAVDGEVVTKPSSPVAPESHLTLVAEPMPYVSRGGLKLAHALEVFPVPIADRIAVDVGASTGGFTDVLLQRGARCVYAIDVGYGQLAWTLRNDVRVVVMERTNIRNVPSLPETVDLAVIDVSFISLRIVVPAVSSLLTDRADMIALIKPQFEAGRHNVGKRGVVRDPQVWRDVLQRVLTFAVSQGWDVRGVTSSPIRGPAGNVEFFAHLQRGWGFGSIEITRAVDEVTNI